MYFIAIVVSGKTGDEITRIKNYFRDHYNSSRALRSPAHITLVPPFRIDAAGLHQLCEKLEDDASSIPSFILSIDGFSAFAPRVIYLAPESSNELHHVYEKIKDTFIIAGNNWTWNRPFNPHITVAFRDLSKEAFREAWKEFRTREFKSDCLIVSVSLLKLEKDGWQVIKNFPFRKNP